MIPGPWHFPYVLDGAGRFRKMWNITLPGIKPTIVVLLIMNLGNILGSNFDRPFAFQNNLVMNVADVISTYVYRTGIKGLQFSLTTAVGLLPPRRSIAMFTRPSPGAKSCSARL